MGHIGQQRAHSRELLALEQGLLLALRLFDGPLAFHGSAKLRTNLRHSIE
jgi:hypothetical protein